MSDPLIRLHQVEKSFPQGAQRSWVLRNIGMAVPAGDFVSITGPSGSGKSTLLGILGLMDTHFDGEYWLDGVAVHEASTRQRQDLQRDKVGFIFQHYHLIDDLTVAENLELPLQYRPVSSSERRARVADLLDRFQMVGKKDLYPNQLSGGQQQQVAVARAIISRPALLLADEPTGALHSSQATQIMGLLQELNDEGMTIIQVTHNPTCAAAARRQLSLFDGWLKQDGDA
ncbi:MAG: ABC transporter ATP-binding protein [Lysobacteraceae bacterium]